jgi:hypothetical protein
LRGAMNSNILELKELIVKEPVYYQVLTKLENINIS